MNRALRRHYTLKWKAKRKDRLGDKCGNPQCGICSTHKKYSKRISKLWKRVQKLDHMNKQEIYEYC